jgi:Flp pilus assembly CpaE family ATPase
LCSALVLYSSKKRKKKDDKGRLLTFIGAKKGLQSTSLTIEIGGIIELLL